MASRLLLCVPMRGAIFRIVLVASAVVQARPVAAQQVLLASLADLAPSGVLDRHDILDLDSEPGAPAAETGADPAATAAVVAPPALSAPSRIFGVLPNFATVEQGGPASPLSRHATFQLAALNSFDPFVFPFIGAMASLHAGAGARPFAERYATAFADNAIGNFMTTAVMPSVIGQDPRYYARGTGHVGQRLAYAASRAIITKSLSGRTQFNVSEIGGNAAAAGLSNLYAQPQDRTVTGMLSRWGMQVLVDTLSNELKEFWPDIRQRLRHR